MCLYHARASMHFACVKLNTQTLKSKNNALLSLNHSTCGIIRLNKQLVQKLLILLAMSAL